MIFLRYADAPPEWQQHTVPAVAAHDGRINVRVPGTDPIGIASWLRGGSRTGSSRIQPLWEPGMQAWSVPRAWLDTLIAQAIRRFGSVYLLQPHNLARRCTPACRNAKRLECECSCMGEQHGGSDWLAPSHAAIVQWGGRELACRLLTRRQCDHGGAFAGAVGACVLCPLDPCEAERAKSLAFARRMAVRQ